MKLPRIIRRLFHRFICRRRSEYVGLVGSVEGYLVKMECPRCKWVDISRQPVVRRIG